MDKMEKSKELVGNLIEYGSLGSADIENLKWLVHQTERSKKLEGRLKDIKQSVTDRIDNALKC